MVLVTLVLLPILSAPVCALLAKKLRAGFYPVIIVCAVETALSVALFDASSSLSLPYAAICLASDGFHAVYALASSFAWLVSALFSVEYFRRHGDGAHDARYIFFYLLTLGATVGVFLSADLFTTFIFFEIASLSSYVWVLHDETDGAMEAARTYLSVAIFGGMVLLFGLLLLSPYQQNGLNIESLVPGAPYAVGVLLLFGFGAKAGMFPLHIWLPKAHPVAPAPASSILSGILTKVGVYGIIITTVRLYAGDVKWGVLLFVLGTVTLLLGAVLALLSVDIKRTLACSSMSQIGFILTGIGAVAALGDECALASAGVVLYMLNHTLMKLILFTIAGIIHMNLHSLDLNDIRGWGRSHPFIGIAFALGGAGLAGIPGTGGYIAKTLLHEAIVESAEIAPIAHTVEILFLFGGGCTLAYMIKLFVCVFIEKPSEHVTKHKGGRAVTVATALALMLAVLPTAFTCIPAIAKEVAARGMAFAGGGEWHDVEFFGWECLSGAVITMTVGIVLYFAFVRTATRRGGNYVNILPAWCDLERTVYVPVINALTRAGGAVARLFGENVLTSRLCRWGMAAAGFVCHLVCDAADLIVYALRRTILRPARERTRAKRSHPVVDAVYRERATDNFSYSLITTVVGVCVILLFLFIVPRL